MNRSGSRSLKAISVLLLLSGAGTLLAQDETFVSNSDSSLSATKPPRAEWQERFTLGPGDVLNFSLVGSPETLRRNLVIGPDGRISYLQARDVVATGLTIDELRERFDQVLTNFYRSPRTIITPVSYFSKKYYVLGAVPGKGVYLFDRPLTVVEAIGRAGGFESGFSGRTVTELADLPRAMLVRDGERVSVDFEKLFLHGDLTQNIALQPEDYLYFPPSTLNQIYVLGAVNSPGVVAFQPNATLMTALTDRGGFNERAWKRRVLVIRGSLNSPETHVIEAADILTARTPDFRLDPKDIVYVHERPWIVAEDLLKIAISSFANAALVQYTGENVRIFYSLPGRKEATPPSPVPNGDPQ